MTGSRRFGLPWVGREVAADAEAAGVSAFCTGDFIDHDAYLSLADMVAGTQQALVGTAIAYGFARTPYAHASAIRQLYRQAPGRLFIGLGSGAFTINRDWLGVPGEKPVRRLSDLVAAVRAWLHADNGQRVRHDGEFYHLDADVRAPVLGRIDVPILMAAFNGRMAGAAGAVADGVIGHGLFTQRWWNDVIRPAVQRGRDSDDSGRAHLEHGWLMTAVDDDEPDRARLDVRRMIAFYLTVRTYDPYVEHHGWEAQVHAVRAAFAHGDVEAMAAAITDEMVAEIAVCGTTDEAREALARRQLSLARDVVYLAPPSYLVPYRRRQLYSRNSIALIDQT